MIRKFAAVRLLETRLNFLTQRFGGCEQTRAHGHDLIDRTITS